MSAGVKRLINELSTAGAEIVYAPIRGVLGIHPYTLNINGRKVGGGMVPTLHDMGLLVITSGDQLRGCVLAPTEEVKRLARDPRFVPESAKKSRYLAWNDIYTALRRGEDPPQERNRFPWLRSQWEIWYPTASIELQLTEEEALNWFVRALCSLPEEKIWNELRCLIQPGSEAERRMLTRVVESMRKHLSEAGIAEFYRDRERERILGEFYRSSGSSASTGTVQ